jgi:hypothetical protein
MKRKGFWVWLGIFVVVVLAMVWYGTTNFIICWDGIEIDEPLLMENCGITEEEYFASENIYETCPEAFEAVSMVGGCETDWSSVISTIGLVAVVYLLISGVGYGVQRLVKGKREGENQ